MRRARWNDDHVAFGDPATHATFDGSAAYSGTIDLRDFFLTAGAPLWIDNRAARHERCRTFQYLVDL